MPSQQACEGDMMITMGNACEFQRPKRQSLPAVSMPSSASITTSSCNPPQGLNKALITATSLSCKGKKQPNTSGCKGKRPRTWPKDPLKYRKIRKAMWRVWLLALWAHFWLTTKINSNNLRPKVNSIVVPIVHQPFLSRNSANLGHAAT